METKTTPKAPEKKYGKFEDHEIEAAARTILEAKEIQEDADKMQYVKPLLERKAAHATKAAGEISSIDDLKAIRKEKAEAEIED